MKKRILSILLTLCMVLCLVPITVFAAGGAKAILPGTSAKSILKIDQSRLSFAGHEWWVIGQKTDESNNAPIITLLAVKNDFGDVPFRTGSAVPFENASRYSEDNGYYANNPSDMSQWRKPNEYAGSTLQQKMVSLAEAIPEKEQAVIRPKDITKGITGQEVKAQKLWALSQEDSIYLYRNSCKYAAQWWTRSSNEVYGYGSWTIHPEGRSGSALNVDYDAAVRPAMELDLSSVLFISAAEHGKVADLTTPIAEYAGDEWKLTLHDSDRDDFTAKTVLVNGSVLEVEYKNAKVGDNEYISAVIKDADGSISRYTRVVQLDGTTNGTRGRAAIDLTGIDMTGKTLCVFNEQFNGDHKTDYAGALREVKLTDEIDEQFTLTPGGRYYFDLSAVEMPGTTLETLPDKTLHYVPFTYVGTVDAYSMENETDTAKQPYEHSLFIADYNVKCSLQRETLAEMNLIYGQTYTASNVNYTLRAPSVGDHHRNEGEGSGLAPIDNEWDTIYQKSADYIKNWYKMRSFGQDIGTGNVEGMYLSRGGHFAAQATFWARPTLPLRDIGFRPVLELPTDLAADSLKAVELLTGEFMPGEQQNWINIIVKKGESFTAPSAEGLPLSDGISADTPMWWVDENLNFYKPGDTVPADVSALSAFYGAFGLFLDRGDGEVEVTPDNYTDIFDDGTASFVLPKGRSLTELGESVNLTSKDILEIYSTGRLERYGCVFPNLKLKNADLTSVRLSKKFIGRENPLFITLDGKNTVGSLNRISMSRNTLSVLGDGSLTLNSALTLGRYTQYGGGSVTMTDGLTAYDLSIDSGSLTVTGDPQAITLRDQDISNLYMGDGVRLFTGSSAQDAAEADVPQLSAKMQEVYKRYQAEDNTLTYEELSALNNALREQFNAIFRQLSGKTYVRITGAWDVTYQPGENGDGNAVTDIKFYNDILTLRSKLFTRTGYTQTGWATIDGGEKIYGLDAVYTQNEALTLYPVWNTNQYTITFDTAGGSEIAPITQDYGTNITAPADPTREGYTFIGWDREIPMTMPAENMTLTARWKDSEKPTGEIVIGTNKWREFLNKLTFGLFFKDTQTVTITAADNSGETVTVEYLLSAKELTKAELDGMTFTAYTAPFGIDPDNEYIIYVRLTDTAGNMDYICSDGIVLDGTSPVITGIENGKTYCEAQTVTVDEKYVDTVTVNGTAVTLDATGSFVLSPADGEQKIVVTDKAGNTAEMTVTVNDGHTFGEWTSNGDGTHTRQCTVDGCTEGVETDNCTDEDKNHICDICGNIISNHEDANQDHVCDLCGKVISNHEDADNNHICDYCDKVISNHEDADKDHVCDFCGKTISNHEDADKDHVCDYCEKIISNHEDADKDHVCDHCGKVISNHEDANKDHVCDHCGKVISNHEDADNNHICDYCDKVISNHEDADKDHVCDFCGKTISNHEDADKDHVCDLCGKVITNHAGGKETCRDKAVCEVCGKAYGELDPKNHTDLKPFPAKAATEDSEGNVEYWHCDDCNKYYSDKDGTKELKKADTVTSKLPKSPQTGDNSNLMLWIALLLISGGALIGTTVTEKKKKQK